MTNAFACTNVEYRQRALERIVPEESLSIFEQRVEEATVVMEPVVGPSLLVRPGVGNIIGSAEGPVLFSSAFQ
eukprot:6951874-Lingulodinium_polyedra.AAC.1